jgi:hypothetical protein
MPFGLFRRHAKVNLPTPDPPVRRLPGNEAVKASVLIVPPDGLVCKTGMKYAEFDVEADPILCR